MSLVELQRQYFIRSDERVEDLQPLSLQRGKQALEQPNNVNESQSSINWVEEVVIEAFGNEIPE